MRQLKIIFTTLFLTLSCNLWAAESAKFLSVADIHFDPFTQCNLSQPKCEIIEKLREANYQDWPAIFEKYGEKTISKPHQDTNYPLLKSTLHELEIETKKENPQFVLLLGDFLGHAFKEKYIAYMHDKNSYHYQDFVRKTLQFLTNEFQPIFPNIDVYPLIGNNDNYGNDYDDEPGGKFYNETAKIWSILIKNKANREKFLREFPTAGYYEITVPTNPNQRIIALNSVLFSNYEHRKSQKIAALAEINWLHKQLQLAKDNHNEVLIADHIPVGIDAYATLQMKFQKIILFWQPTYTEKFENEIAQFSSLISAIFSAHIHSMKFQFIVLNKIGSVPVYITPSISPIYGNDPGFKVFSYNLQTLQIGDVNSFSFALGSDKGWQSD